VCVSVKLIEDVERRLSDTMEGHASQVLSAVSELHESNPERDELFAGWGDDSDSGFDSQSFSSRSSSHDDDDGLSV
jgi:hypothetical protein